MKVTEIKPKIVEPPKRVLLDLSQEEAGMLWYFANYYATTTDAFDRALAGAKRLADSLKQYNGKYAYPYDYFHEEK